MEVLITIKQTLMMHSIGWILMMNLKPVNIDLEFHQNLNTKMEVTLNAAYNNIERVIQSSLPCRISWRQLCGRSVQ